VPTGSTPARTLSKANPFPVSAGKYYAFGRLFGITDLGQGALEVFTSPGDSGGLLLSDGQIAGLAGYTFGLTIGTSGLHINSRTDSPFGEFASMIRVSSYAEWIDRMLRADLRDAPTQSQDVVREVAEGNSGKKLAYFLVQLSNPSRIYAPSWKAL
jgi:hypothetical protein